jgi:hypothetical protein
VASRFIAIARVKNSTLVRSREFRDVAQLSRALLRHERAALVAEDGAVRVAVDVPSMLRAVEQIATLLVGFIPRLRVSILQLRLVDRFPVFQCVSGGSHPDEKYR